MFQKMTAIAAAASCAGLVVAFVPGFAPEVAAGASQSMQRGVASAGRMAAPPELPAAAAAEIQKAVQQNLRSGSRNPKIICQQSWPFYEQSCMRDGRSVAARTVRIIATDAAAAAITAATRNAAHNLFAQALARNVARPAARAAHAKR